MSRKIFIPYTFSLECGQVHPFGLKIISLLIFEGLLLCVLACSVSLMPLGSLVLYVVLAVPSRSFRDLLSNRRVVKPHNAACTV